jgi:hypothetical protein
MPGAYTHLTIARLLTSDNEIRKMGLPDAARKALLGNSEFCQMGAISPDYPYLKLLGEGKDEGEEWANAMHHKYGTMTENNIIHLGIEYIKGLDGNAQSKCLAWFLGYASHVTADVTIHPVTNLLVGDYEADGVPLDHRVSEMHQDVYIFKTRVNGDVEESDHIKNVVGICTDPTDKNKIDQNVEQLWTHMLRNAFPMVSDNNEIDIHGWHKAVQIFLDGIASNLSALPSRHVREYLSAKGVSYPRFEDIDSGDFKKFLKELDTPKGKMDYDVIFDLALDNAGKVWKLISDGIFNGDDSYAEKIKIWNLDNGQDVRTPKILWEGTL